ncbi:hypothetical protein DH2020_028350 [Rehmannia glutinosa]|uniref:Reverse transcriptase Ty1/copia-type domain-containing protein n=1 Tax=Rehmannia glutinosa TaxID=99300 RepID=A0ABR0VV88_REHGL
MSIINNKWMFRIKYNPDGSVEKYKARVVAKGFQQVPGVDIFETYSPVVKPCTIRLILTFAVTNNWTIQQIVVNNAFLNGTLKETVFMVQPEGFTNEIHPTHVCQLHKALYGLKQAPRGWFDELKTYVVSLGFRMSISDSSLFFKNQGGKHLFILVYVDDILLTGDDNDEIMHVIQLLGQKFALKTLGEVTYFLGLEAKRTSAGLTFTQTKYISDLLAKPNMSNCKPVSTPLCTSLKLALNDSKPFDCPSVYRSTIGTLHYLTMSKPDISFDVSKLSQYLHAPTVNHWSACKHLLRYLKGTSKLGLCFYPAQRLSLQAFSDADWASNLDDRKSTGGFCVCLGSNLLTWSSKK